MAKLKLGAIALVAAIFPWWKADWCRAQLSVRRVSVGPMAPRGASMKWRILVPATITILLGEKDCSYPGGDADRAALIFRTAVRDKFPACWMAVC
jgi:hypothetical protein